MKKFSLRFGSLIISTTILLQTSVFGQINQKSNNAYQEQNENIDSKMDPNKYILGKGDRLSIIFDEFDNIAGNNLSVKNILIGPDGYINLKRIGNINVEGKTINQFKNIIEDKYSLFLLKRPLVRVFVELHRPVTVYVTGEVAQEGYYILSGTTFSEGKSFGSLLSEGKDEKRIDTKKSIMYTFPTLFDAIKAAKGVTLYSDLSNISVIRKVPEIDGGGLIQTKINLEELLISGDLSKNINLRDGDLIEVSRSKNKRTRLFYQAANSNLNPRNISVFVSGQVETSGKLLVPSGSPLNVAINLTGKQLLSGNIEFFRFNKDGSFERREFRYKPNAEIDSYSNPILMTNDFVRVKNSLFTTTTKVLSTVTAPVITTFGVKQLLED